MKFWKRWKFHGYYGHSINKLLSVTCDRLSVSGWLVGTFPLVYPRIFVGVQTEPLPASSLALTHLIIFCSLMRLFTRKNARKDSETTLEDHEIPLEIILPGAHATFSCRARRESHLLSIINEILDWFFIDLFLRGDNFCRHVTVD
jgi:hypothetical protein